MKWTISRAGVAETRATFAQFLVNRTQLLTMVQTLRAMGKTLDTSELTPRQRTALLTPQTMELSRVVRWRPLSELRANPGDTPPTEPGIAYFADCFATGLPVPPITVYPDGMLWDGHHRLEGAHRVGLTEALVLEVLNPGEDHAL